MAAFYWLIHKSTIDSILVEPSKSVADGSVGSITEEYLRLSVLVHDQLNPVSLP